MIFLHILRMMTDAAFYGAIAGFVSCSFGGCGALASVMLQCLCFGLSYLGKEKRTLRLLFTIPMIFGWFLCKEHLADCILLIPTGLYILRLIWNNDYTLDQYRQKKLFHIFWKTILIFSIAMVLAGSPNQVIEITIPYTTIMILSSILLLRSLRHDPDVYLHPAYQVFNSMILLAVTAFAYLLSTNAMKKQYGKLLSWFQKELLQPVFEWFFSILMFCLNMLLRLLSFLPFTNHINGFENTVEVTGESASDLFGYTASGNGSGKTFHIIFCSLLILGAIVLIRSFFRWLSKGMRPDVHTSDLVQALSSSTFSESEKHGRDTGSVRKIRSLYKDLLKWCSKQIHKPGPAHTSLDVHQWISSETSLEETSMQIRNLYLNARYANTASKTEVKEMKQLCSDIKKSEKQRN